MRLWIAAAVVACTFVTAATASPSFVDTIHVGRAAGAPNPERQLSSSAKNCQPKALYNRRQFKNVAGMVLWEYIQQIYFCTSNGYVTYFYRYRFARIPSVTPVVDWTVWEFDGNTNTNCGNEHCFVRGGKARSRTAWTQGKFHACLVLDRLMCNSQMPELSMTVYGTGGYSPWTKGG